MPLTHDIGVRIPYPLQKRKAVRDGCFFLFVVILTFPPLCPLPLVKGGLVLHLLAYCGGGILIYQLLASEIFC